jgi:nucleotide-binding universal stress UspA family protein
MIRIVTVPLDLTDTADRAIAPANVIARQLDAIVELAVVTSPGLDRLADEHALKQRAEQVIGVATERVVLSSNDELAALAPYFEDTERLVCMASHGRGRVGDVLAPSVTLALMRDSARPILVVGPHLGWWPGPVGTIYLGVDEHGVPGGVLEVVGDFADALGSDVSLVHVREPDGRAPRSSNDEVSVDRALEHLRDRGSPASALELAGDPADTLGGLAARAAACSIIAVTTRVDTRLGRILRGSVTSQLVATSPVPVLVIPATISVGEHPHVGEVVAIDRGRAR